jgi:hypothetical protein
MNSNFGDMSTILVCVLFSLDTVGLTVIHNANQDKKLSASDWITVRGSVVVWSNVLEWYGLVDYERGFAEEEIIKAIHTQWEHSSC